MPEVLSALPRDGTPPPRSLPERVDLGALERTEEHEHDTRSATRTPCHAVCPADIDGL